MNPFGVPGLSVQEVAQKRTDGDDFVLLDVREPHELNFANLGDEAILVPLSQLVQKGQDALPQEVTADKDTVVFCHHGTRSAQVVAWLRQQGWTNVYNMDGGIEAYAIAVDPEIGRY